MWVFEERGKLKYPEKTSQSKGDNQQQTQPTYGVNPRIWTREVTDFLACKRYLFWAEPPQVGHEREFTPKPPAPTPPNTTTSGIFSLPVKSVHNKMLRCFITKIALFSYFLFFIDQQNGIPLPVTPKKPWSIDANLMHIRCGDLTLAPISTYKFSKLNIISQYFL